MKKITYDEKTELKRKLKYSPTVNGQFGSCVSEVNVVFHLCSDWYHIKFKQICKGIVSQDWESLLKKFFCQLFTPWRQWHCWFLLHVSANTIPVTLLIDRRRKLPDGLESWRKKIPTLAINSHYLPGTGSLADCALYNDIVAVEWLLDPVLHRGSCSIELALRSSSLPENQKSCSIVLYLGSTSLPVTRCSLAALY